MNELCHTRGWYEPAVFGADGDTNTHHRHVRPPPLRRFRKFELNLLPDFALKVPLKNCQNPSWLKSPSCLSPGCPLREGCSQTSVQHHPHLAIPDVARQPTILWCVAKLGTCPLLVIMQLVKFNCFTALLLAASSNFATTRVGHGHPRGCWWGPDVPCAAPCLIVATPGIIAVRPVCFFSYIYI